MKKKNYERRSKMELSELEKRKITRKKGKKDENEKRIRHGRTFNKLDIR